MKTRQEIKARAREALREQRGTAILLPLALAAVTVISIIIDELTMRLLGPLAYWIVFWIGMLVIYVATINMTGEFIKIYKSEDASAGAVFTGLAVNFLRKLGGMLWMLLWVTLWSFLFVIPGIIKFYAYYLAPYILAHHPDVGAREALRLSSRMTKGYKGDLFVMTLSFIGWFFLSTFTLGILSIVFVMPYFYITSAGFFVELRDLAIENGTVTREELGMESARESGSGSGGGHGSGVFEG